MSNEIIDERIYLKRFNDRDSIAFGYFYEKLYNDLYYYASKLYKNTEVSADDAIHDIFVSLWDSKQIRFDNIFKLKAYLIISIKNRYKNHIDHQRSSGRYISFFTENNKSFVTHVAEVEVMSLINNAMDMLPEECAKVFKLHLEEWEVRDIANKLGKAQSTVYAQKQKAISILKGKLKSLDILR
jgi:RNA polymerase sigma factor (sigma-70 family)